MKRLMCAQMIRDRLKPDAVVLCGLGSTGGAWRAQKAPQLTYSVSDPMGMALSLALGLALAQPKRDVVLLDGDGDFCTGVSALFAIAGTAPPNLKIAVFNNRRYESGGGQPLPGTDSTSLSMIARGAGLAWVEDEADIDRLGGTLDRWLAQPQTALLVLAIDPEPSPYPPVGPWSKAEERAVFMNRLLGS